jgi:hypothetical protein
VISTFSAYLSNEAQENLPARELDVPLTSATVGDVGLERRSEPVYDTKSLFLNPWVSDQAVQVRSWDEDSGSGRDLSSLWERQGFSYGQ